MIRICCLLVALSVLAHGGAYASSFYLDEVDLAASVRPKPKAWRGAPQAKKSIKGKPLVLGSVTYERGVGMRCQAIHLDLDRAERFEAVVGIDDASGLTQRHRPAKQGRGWVRFFLDGEEIYDTGFLTRTSAPQRVALDLRGRRRMVIEGFGGDFGSSYGAFQADIGEGRFTLAEGGSVKAIAADDPSVEEWGILTPPASERPRINGPRVFGVRPGRPVFFRLPVTGLRPFEITVTGLPDGVMFDPESRLLTGAVARPGTYPIAFLVRNSRGWAKQTLRLIVGDRIALTPALGWNSWNCFMRDITAEKALAQAAAMVNSELVEHGWSYICLDAHWARTEDPKMLARHPVEWAPPCRNADGTIRPTAFFPDMKKYVDAIHAKGLKAGIYSSPSFIDCGQCAGVGTNIAANVRQFVDWGFDYLKYDYCGAGSVTKHYRREQDAGRFVPPKGFDMHENGDAALFALMGEELRRQPRDIVYALSQVENFGAETWGASVGAASWRCDGDLTDIWERVVTVPERNAPRMKGNRPGFVADLDMLCIGFTRDGIMTFLTPNQQYTHLSIWAITASTMMLGCDLTKMDDFTRALLSNDEVLAVSQDELVAPAELKVVDHGTQIWTRRLADGSFAALAVNKRPFKRRLRFDFAALGLPKTAMLRDLWRQRTLGDKLSSYEVELPPCAPFFVQVDDAACDCTH